MSYQGYKNYETFALSLWLDNDSKRQAYWNSLAQDYVSTYGFEPKYSGTYSDATIHLAYNIKEVMEDNAPDLENGIYGDLLNSAMSEIDYRQIAKSYTDCTKEGIKYFEAHTVTS